MSPDRLEWVHEKNRRNGFCGFLCSLPSLRRWFVVRWPKAVLRLVAARVASVGLALRFVAVFLDVGEEGFAVMLCGVRSHAGQGA